MLIAARPALACLCALAAIGVLAACGHDTPAKTTAASASPAQRAAFIKQGDAICAAYNTVARRVRRVIAEQHAQVVATNSLKPYAASLAIARDSAKIALSAFTALKVPRGDEDRVRTLRGAMTDQQQLLDKVANATAVNDEATFSQLNQRLIAAGAQERRLARAYGFEQCGRRS